MFEKSSRHLVKYWCDTQKFLFLELNAPLLKKMQQKPDAPLWALLQDFWLQSERQQGWEGWPEQRKGRKALKSEGRQTAPQQEMEDGGLGMGSWESAGVCYKNCWCHGARGEHMVSLDGSNSRPPWSHTMWPLSSPRRLVLWLPPVVVHSDSSAVDFHSMCGPSFLTSAPARSQYLLK